jgi:hypothetical protein
MSTNMAKRNSTPSRLAASLNSAAFVIVVDGCSRVLVRAHHLHVSLGAPTVVVNDVA